MPVLFAFVVGLVAVLSYKVGRHRPGDPHLIVAVNGSSIAATRMSSMYAFVEDERTFLLADYTVKSDAERAPDEDVRPLRFTVHVVR